ncbi:ATP-binding protein [Streptomyces sp. S.PNR 29]|uniref:ATP-binding protein n=1 Tax=Streptomyces sp. S.PNR 29 TaxID=2973805 RepID=UPI0025AED908|nr:ATP-binding protein [Streptomyces sp. S.PNR 29]MDN0201281.1 ATP-binding protein [Streptomyces sp. S.PNR 29]
MDPTTRDAVHRPRNATAYACCTLPTETQAAARARAFARARLAAWELGGEVAEEAGLVVSEFVTNAVRHSGSPRVTLRLARCPAHLWIEVCDTGVWRAPAGPQDDGVAEGGRGFWLVEALAERCGIHRESDGTRVWALIRHAPSTSL